MVQFFLKRCVILLLLMVGSTSLFSQLPRIRFIQIQQADSSGLLLVSDSDNNISYSSDLIYKDGKFMINGWVEITDSLKVNNVKITGIIDSTRLNADGDSLLYYQNGILIGGDAILSTILSDSVTIYGDGTLNNRLYVDTSIITTKRYVDSLTSALGGGAIFQQTFIADGIQDTFVVTDNGGNLPVNIKDILVVHNGLVLDDGLFTADQLNSKITLSYVPNSGNRVTVVWFDAIAINGMDSVFTDNTITGNGLISNPIKVDTTTVSTIQGLVDSLTNYVTIAGTDTITGAKTFTTDLNIDAKIALNAGDNNIVIGDGAGANLVSGQGIRNILIGTSVGAAIDSGYFNLAIGDNALLNNTTGYQNVAIGIDALKLNIDGFGNIANGIQALGNNRSGIYNIAFGIQALYSMTSGSENFALGVSSLRHLSSGSKNQAYGFQAGRYIDGGSNLTTANGSLFLGTNTRASANNNTNEIVIGTDAIGNGSYSVTIGNTSNTKTILNGNVGIGETNPSAKLDVVGDVEISDTLTLTTYDEGILSVDNVGKVMTTNLIEILENTSLGEGYADVAKEYHYSDGKTVYPNKLGRTYAELLQADVLDKTSLILTPTAIATGVVASQKPLSSDGDFTFTRSTSATRVNENGYIEKETQNLLLQSNTFNTTWTTVDASVTGGQAGYDGTNNAWLLTAATPSPGASRLEQYITLTGLQTYSVYAKAGLSNFMLIDVTGTNPYYAWFNLSTGAVETKVGEISTDITSVGNGWYRCSITGNPSATSQARIFIADNNGATLATDENYIYIQDAQLEQGLVARDYIETTTSAVYGGVTINVPRIDYTDKTPSLLLEPQRTNSLAYSEFIAAGITWATSGGMLTESNSVASPENLVNATKMTRPNGTGAAWLTNFLGGVVGQNQVLSVYAKAGTATIFNITYYDATAGDLFFNYDLSAGSVSAPTENAYYVDSSIEDVGNGWYRCIAIVETANTGQYQIAIGNNRYGVANEYLYVYGTQWESNASYPTSYIPTYGTSVTRLEDFSTADITSALSSNQGTLFIHLDDDADSGGYSSGALSIGLLDTAETVWVGWASNSPASTELRGIYRVGGSTTFVGASTPINTECKLLIKWGGGTVSFFKNGSLYNTQSVTDFSGQPLEQYQLPKQIRAGNYPIKQTLIFPTALTDSECIALTKIN